MWLGDIPVATLRPNGGSVAVYYVHTDHLNTPRRISRPSDNVIVWRWDSDPFGTTAASQDPDGDSTNFVYNFRFPGQYYDAETGLNYNYFRDYVSQTGRYVESDPIGLEGGLNTFAYVGSAPTAGFDEFGLEPGGPWHPPKDTSLSCKSSDSCPQIEAKMGQLQRMIASHTGWDQKMPRPRGGNRHADEIADLWRAFGKCQQLHNTKCKSNCPRTNSENVAKIGTTALLLGGAACIAFPELCIPGLIMGGAMVGATQ
ncbi:MAG: RHS repeat-associated core domain-containing protein [Steroidobacteraceae bacterium]